MGTRRIHRLWLVPERHDLRAWSVGPGGYPQSLRCGCGGGGGPVPARFRRVPMDLPRRPSVSCRSGRRQSRCPGQFPRLYLRHAVSPVPDGASAAAVCRRWHRREGLHHRWPTARVAAVQHRCQFHHAGRVEICRRRWCGRQIPGPPAFAGARGLPRLLDQFSAGTDRTRGGKYGARHLPAVHADVRSEFLVLSAQARLRYMYMPPFTAMTCPVMYPASSLARNFTAAAMSSGFPIRPSGTDARIFARTSSDSTFVMSVSMYPGATALTVMLRLAISCASVFVTPISPAFDAA